MLALLKKRQKLTERRKREDNKKQLLNVSDITPNDPLKSTENQNVADGKFKNTQ